MKFSNDVRNIFVNNRHTMTQKSRNSKIRNIIIIFIIVANIESVFAVFQNSMICRLGAIVLKWSSSKECFKFNKQRKCKIATCDGDIIFRLFRVMRWLWTIIVKECGVMWNYNGWGLALACEEMYGEQCDGTVVNTQCNRIHFPPMYGILISQLQ